MFVIILFVTTVVSFLTFSQISFDLIPATMFALPLSVYVSDRVEQWLDDA